MIPSGMRNKCSFFGVEIAWERLTEIGKIEESHRRIEEKRKKFVLCLFCVNQMKKKGRLHAIDVTVASGVVLTVYCDTKYLLVSNFLCFFNEMICA